MRKWAQVAGICKAIWHLQLDQLHIEQGMGGEWLPHVRYVEGESVVAAPLC